MIEINEEEKKIEEKEEKLEKKQETKPEVQEGRLKELEEKLLWLQAEFENFKKRNVKESEALVENANAAILLKLLPVIDEMEIAVKHTKDEGMKMIYKNMMKTLASEGLTEMDAVGKQFDPYYHEALRNGDGEEGKIIEIVQKGYLFKGKVLRHAKVVVGRGIEKENDDKKGDEV